MPAGSPTAGGRLRRGLVVKGERDGVEHVEPEALLPLPVLRQVDAQMREAESHRDRGLDLRRLAVSENVLSDLLGGVDGDGDALLPREPADRECEAVNAVEPRHRVVVGLLKDDGPRAVRSEPAP